jgi:hypothetical protein
MPEGRESPPPERQSGKQLHDPPAEGFGTREVGNKGEEMKDELKVGVSSGTMCNLRVCVY